MTHVDVLHSSEELGEL